MMRRLLNKEKKDTLFIEGKDTLFIELYTSSFKIRKRVENRAINKTM